MNQMKRIFRDHYMLRWLLIMPALAFFLVVHICVILPMQWVAEKFDKWGYAVERFFAPSARAIFGWSKRPKS
jgi:hypothetical protein